MEFTYQDRQTLYDAWMSYKAKLRITQIEMAKRLGINQLDFSRVLRGDVPLEQGFVYRFCKEIGIEPDQSLPSLKALRNVSAPSGPVTVRTSLTVDGTISKVEYQGNQVFIEFETLP
ncbi:helix-turn-helix transcriptional regulator [Enterovibrio norvegicus]|uniref:L-threonine 3-dehydrogenase n=1 Tax=Enterovibrio norvegicus TaxID=188144 RepID=A0A2N7LGZ0_9GAMM|nr:helix-turn-helix transcriptional regulator [Enterovibrio norvegicus]PMN64367.1 L-threonine 3-dehydrogenase [Enterovibrio norvegicus]PMN94755.1 L-threonine 3-dehydrogenase [Enterovibrio norvegicus]